MNKLILRAASARQRFENVRTRGIKNFAAEHGAVDLASIMVGVLVIGIVGGVIAATVFAVIPWAQDQAAEQALSAVSTSQSVGYAGSSSDGLGTYLNKAELVNGTGTSIAADGLLQDSDSIAVLTTGADSTGYVAASISDTGKVFWITNTNPSTVAEAVDIAALNTATGSTFVASDFEAVTAP